MSNMVVSRFSSETFMRNKIFRETVNVGCIYGTPFPINKFNPNEVIFVIEMNLTTNKIEGIGLVLNIVKSGSQYTMYEDYNYNRYVYCGKYRLDREDIERLLEETSTEEPKVNITDILDKALFKGKSHMKRGSHYSRITDNLLEKWGSSCKKIQETIIKMFVDKFGITIHMEEEVNYEIYGL